MVTLFARHDGHHQKDKGYFTHNDRVARVVFWAVVLVFVVGLGSRRLFLRWSQRRTADLHEFQLVDGGRRPGRPQNIWLLALAVTRWGLYPRYSVSFNIMRRMPSLSMGEILFIVVYLAFTWALLLVNVFFPSPSEQLDIDWEVIGFRAAWVATAQLPLLYCTSGRVEPISLITGISDTRIKRFHALIGINVFLVLIVHWASFVRIWDGFHTLAHNLLHRPMVSWGFAAWAVFGLTIVLAIAPLRVWYYEPWLISHGAMGSAGLFLSYTHTRCTTYFVVASLSLIALNYLGKLALLLRMNLHPFRCRSAHTPLWGHQTQLQVVNDEYLGLQILCPGITWKSGQHIYINIPEIRMFEYHPFTIANSSSVSGSDKHMRIIIRKQDGFTRLLFRAAADRRGKSLRVVLQGPFGHPPHLGTNNTVVFVASGNRASFVFPLLADLCHDPGSVTAISVHLITPTSAILAWYEPMIVAARHMVQQSDVDLSITVHLTRSEAIPLMASTYIAAGAEDDQHHDGLFIVESDSDHELDDPIAEKIRQRHDNGGTDLEDEEAATLLQAVTVASSTHVSDMHRPKRTCTSSDSPVVRLNTVKSADDKDGESTATPSCLSSQPYNLFHGRPTSETMIDPAMAHSSSTDKVMVVAAVGDELLVSLSAHVSRQCGRIALSKRSNWRRGRVRRGSGESRDIENEGNGLPGSISLWCESNGP